MMRWASLGSMFGGLPVLGVMLLVGCTPPPPPPVVESVQTEAHSVGGGMQPGGMLPETGSVVSGAAVGIGAMRVREVKVVEDNGQHGIFAKLSVAPRAESHFTLAEPNRLIIELEGDASGAPIAAQYPVDNSIIKQIGVGSHQGKIRMTVTLKGDDFPSYTVDVLNDTLVAFLGEPMGATQAVREQVVFTDRAVAGALPPPAPIASAPPSSLGAEPLTPAAGPRGASKRSRGGAGAIAGGQSLSDEAEEFASGDQSDEPRFLKKGSLYYGQPISLDLKEADIHNVLRLIAEVSKLNIVATSDVRGTVTLRLFDVPWDQALDIMLQVMSLESVREGNVIRVSTVKRLREEREERKRARDAQRDAEPLQVAYIRVNYAKAKALAALVTGGTGKGGGGKGGGADRSTGVLTPRGSAMADEFTNTVIVRDIERGIVDAMDLLRRLDVQTPEVLIESNIVEATASTARDLGVQWGYRASVGPQTGSSTGFNFPGMIGFGGSGLGTGASGVPAMVDFPAGGNFASGNGSALNLILGSLDGTQALDMRITALEEQGKASVISKPRVVTLNNVPAVIKSVTIIRVRMPGTTTQIATGGSAVAPQTTATEKIETGITLHVTPQVSSDGFIMLDMNVKSSQADFSRTVDNIPTEIDREANSHVLVRDGQTFVIGGVYRDTSAENTKAMPFFGTIPGMGWLFRSDSRAQDREDLLVFITPRILGTTKAFGGMPTAAELWQQRAQRREPG